MQVALNQRRLLLICALLACSTTQSQELVWKYDFQSNSIKEDAVTKTVYDRTLNNVTGNRPPPALPNRVVGYSIRNVQYQATGICYVDDVNLGVSLKNSPAKQHLTYHWKDDSTLTIKQTAFEVCAAIDEQYNALDYGEYFWEGMIVDGTGRFKDASGSSATKGSYRVLWNNEDALSSLIELKVTVNLD